MKWLGLNFADSLEHVWSLVEKRQPVAVSRFGDGECLLMTSRAVHGQATRVDNWGHDGGDSALGKALLEVAENENIIHGISCKCHQPTFHSELQAVCKGTLTFATMFHNGNHSAFQNKLQSLNRPVFIVGRNDMLPLEQMPFFVNGVYKVTGNCVQEFEAKRGVFYEDMKLISSAWKDTLILLSAGPLATVFVHWLSRFNPDIQALDVGSAIDPYLFGKETRRYHNQTHRDRYKACVL